MYYISVAHVTSTPVHITIFSFFGTYIFLLILYNRHYTIASRYQRYQYFVLFLLKLSLFPVHSLGLVSVVLIFGNYAILNVFVG